MSPFVEDLTIWLTGALQPGRGLSQSDRSVGVNTRPGHEKVISNDASTDIAEGERGESKTGAFDLVLPASRYILRILSPLRVPASQARAMAMLDLATATPFNPEDVYCLAVERIGQPMNSPTAYAVIKRSALESQFGRARKDGSTIGGLLLEGVGKQPEWRAMRHELARIDPLPAWRRRLRLGVAGLLTLGIVATSVNFALAYAGAKDLVASKMPALEDRAMAVREEINRRAARVAELDSLRSSLASERSMSEVLEELSRVLPDTAYLTDITIKEGQASLIGFSVSASSIIAPLEGSPIFQGAEFASPVVRVPGQNGERFELKMSILSK